jgi:hypothetical protein
MLLLGGALFRTPALADGVSSTTCTNASGEVVCVGFVVNTSVRIVIRDVRILNDNEITVLGINLTGLLASNDVVSEQDLQARYSKIAHGVLPILRGFGITVCSVEVANLATASC